MKDIMAKIALFHADQAIKLAVKIGIKLQDEEDNIYAIKVKPPTEIMGNFTNICFASLTELS
jgi:hypothetical protein